MQPSPSRTRNRRLPAWRRWQRTWRSRAVISLVASAGVVAGAATLHAVDPATAAPRSGVPATAIPAGSSAVATERNGAQSPATVPAAAAVPPVAAPGADPFPGGFVPQTQTHGS